MGYYRSDDESVIRRHAQMLADAGVDAIFCDVTNALTYDKTLMTLCRVFEQVRKEGGRTPQIAFITHSAHERVVRHLYESFYAKKLYPDLWFQWKGKPLLLSSQEGLDETIRGFFTFRESWAWTSPKDWFGDGRDKWAWLDHTPQQPGWHESREKPEQICVAVAEHPVSNIGRSFHDGHEPPPEAADPAHGLHFAEQWKRALDVDPELIFVTGWNEWVAQRFIKTGGRGAGTMLGRKLTDGQSYFVDTYSEEYSRDIEPMRGGHGDAFYYQLIANIRRFKGVRPLERASAAKTIDMTPNAADWADVRPEYQDDLFDTARRDHPAFGRATGEPERYIDTSGRNDLDGMKVARDANFVYFYVRTREPLTLPAAADESWMRLLIDIDQNPSTGWNGYDVLINRTRPAPGVCSVEASAGGQTWKPIGQARLVTSGNVLQIAVPLALISPERRPLSFDFKWTDGIPPDADMMDFIDKGDVAPNGRFNYRWGE